jgi:hypothetical protein
MQEPIGQASGYRQLAVGFEFLDRGAGRLIEAVEDGAAPIRSPIGSLWRAEVVACVLAAGAVRAGARSIALSGGLAEPGVDDCEFGGG